MKRILGGGVLFCLVVAGCGEPNIKKPVDRKQKEPTKKEFTSSADYHRSKLPVAKTEATEAEKAFLKEVLDAHQKKDREALLALTCLTGYPPDKLDRLHRHVNRSGSVVDAWLTAPQPEDPRVMTVNGKVYVFNLETVGHIAVLRTNGSSLLRYGVANGELRLVLRVEK